MTGVEPQSVIQLVESYVDEELSDVKKFDNRAPLDESGIWSLHDLAAKIYAQGYQDGERAEGERAQRRRVRGAR